MDKLELRPAKTALIVIDLQKGIARMPTAPHDAATVIQNAKRLADALRAQGGFIVFVRVAGSPDGKDRLHPACDSPLGGGPLPADWSELVPDLEVQAGDLVLTKKQWGAFYGTELDLQLRRRGLTTIILCGIATCFGVESTARDAFERGYEQVFAEDATSSRTAAEHEHTVGRILPRIGLVRKTADILAALS
jgi:nicotinamidase-related amidase